MRKPIFILLTIYITIYYFSCEKVFGPILFNQIKGKWDVVSYTDNNNYFHISDSAITNEYIKTFTIEEDGGIVSEYNTGLLDGGRFRWKIRNNILIVSDWRYSPKYVTEIIELSEVKWHFSLRNELNYIEFELRR